MNVNRAETTCISLCSGYEGIGLGIKRVIPNVRTILYSEIEKYACEVLVQRMEEGKIDVAPIWTNLKTLPCEQFSGKINILTAGYPCQPFSLAGKRAGKDDPRHLWPHIARAISIIRPDICFFENVEGHITMGLREVIADLVSLGYRVETDSGEPTWGIFSASEVGAPHRRKRLFIMAYRDAAVRHEILEPQGKQGDVSFGGCTDLADSDSGRSGENIKQSELRASLPKQSSCDSRGGSEDKAREKQRWPARPGEEQYTWEKPRVI